MLQPPKQCFVITPFGKKKVPGIGIVDFDEVHRTIVVPAVELAGNGTFIVERAKDDPTTGVINEAFTKASLAADIAIIDVTGNNPNVYYELGMRHVFRKRVNVLIGCDGTELPFNVAEIVLIPYDRTSKASRERSAKNIAGHIIKALKEGNVDSPVYKYLPDLRVGIPDSPDDSDRTLEWTVTGSNDKRIGIKTGALDDIRGVDVWVNSENTEMEMARPYEKSISSVIRYYGATHDKDGRVKKDLIQNDLIRQLGSKTSVTPATVLVTTPGNLAGRGVKSLLHVASAEGAPGRGYRPITDVHRCVTSCLEKIDRLNAKRPSPKLTSVLFPIFGTGQGGQQPENVLPGLLRKAVQFVKNNPKSLVDRIYFLAYTVEHATLCHHMFSRFPGLDDVPPPALATGTKGTP